MKIFYSGYKYDYGKKELGYSFEYVNFLKTFQNFKNSKVFNFPTDLINLYGEKKFNEKAKKIIDSFQFDFAFFVLFQDEFSDEFLKYLKQKPKVNSIAWMSDDHWRFDNYSKKKLKLFNYIVTTDENSVLKYKSNGFDNIILSQWGFNNYSYSNTDLNDKKKIFDVSFVGQPHSNRRNIIKKLTKDGFNVYCRGNGWENGRVEFDEMIDIFQKSKINLNFSSSSTNKNFKNFIKIFLKKSGNTYRFYNLFTIFTNIKNYFKKNTRQIKGRVFEITGLGCFLISENVEYLNKYFSIDKEIVTFDNYNDLKKKINFYLTKEDIRSKVAENAKKRTLAEHTFEKRFSEIFSIIKNK
jgi:spore maturation protein CgeB